MQGVFSISEELVGEVKVDKKNVQDKFEDIQNGIAIAFTFLIIGVFLYFNPFYLDFVILSQFLAIILFFIGIIGLGIELNKIEGSKFELGFSDLGIGLAFLFAWVVIYYFFQIWWINFLDLFVLFFSVYFIIIGIVKVFRNLFSYKSKKSFLITICIVASQFAAFIAAIVTILNILEFI